MLEKIKHQIALINHSTVNPKRVAIIFEILKLPSLILSLWLSHKMYTELVNTNYICSTLFETFFTSIVVIFKILFIFLFPVCLGIWIDSNSKY